MKKRLRTLRRARRLVVSLADRLEEIGAELDELRELGLANCFFAASLDFGRLEQHLTKRLRAEREAASETVG
jgi:hypothetical protein